MSWGSARRTRRNRTRLAAQDVVQALWPDEASPTMRWRPVTGAGGLRVVPSAARPAFLVSSGRASSIALKPVAPGLKGLRLSVAGALQRRSLAHWLPGSVVQVNRRAGAPAGIEGLLEMVFGQEVFDVAVLLDRPVRRRRVMLWAIGQDGQPLGVVKLSREAFDQPSLEREYEALCSSSPAVPGLRRPSALAYVRWRGHDVLAVEALTPAARATAVEVPMEQMQAVAGFPERSPEPLAQTSFATHLAAQVSALDPDIGGRWASEAFDDLLARYGTVLVTPGPCHGDWTWWNMAWDGDVVMLWDWEHFSEHAIQGFDHLHFLSRAQHHASTGAASEDLWVAQAQAALARAWEVTGELEQEAVIAAYLLDMNVRHFADRQYLGPGVEPSRDWGPALLERLTLNAAQPRIPPGA